MKETIIATLKDELEEENRMFFNLLDSKKWDLLIDKYAETGNKKSINELLKELLES